MSLSNNKNRTTYRGAKNDIKSTNVQRACENLNDKKINSALLFVLLFDSGDKTHTHTYSTLLIKQSLVRKEEEKRSNIHYIYNKTCILTIFVQVRKNFPFNFFNLFFLNIAF